MAFTLASRQQIPARFALTGPTNAGKTYSSLLIALGILKGKFPELSDEDLYKKIIYLDTERGRAKFYAGRTDLPYKTYAFQYMEIEAPYHPSKLMDAVDQAIEAFGKDIVIVVDSLSHFWSYEGGVLDMKTALDKKGGNSYTNWADLTDIHNKMINKLLGSPTHIVATMRSKMDYVLEQNSQGKMAPKQVGLKPMQRDDTEFEFDLTLMLDKDHNATIIKDTTFLREIADEVGNIGVVTPELGTRIYQWLNNAENPENFKQKDLEATQASIKELANDPDLKMIFKVNYPGKKIVDLSLADAKKALFELRSAQKLKGGK